MKYFYTFLLFISTSFACFSQNYVGLYVNNFKDIIGNPSAETQLLNYAQDNGFNYLILYNLTYIQNNIFAIDDVTTSLPLANFIEDAKTNYGILQVAAVGEKNASFDKIKIYNSFYPSNPSKRFDVFNLEFEFWNDNQTGPSDYYCTTYLQPNGYTCDEAGAFQFYISQLALMKAYGDQNGIITETYIGYISPSEGDLIATNTNRVLIHYYRSSDVYNNGDSIFQYHPERLENLSLNNNVTVMPIFSSRPNHMYNWLLAPHSLSQPYSTFLNGTNGFNSQPINFKRNISLDGYVWYRYGELLQIDQQLLAFNEQSIENSMIYYNNLDKNIHFINFNPQDKMVIYNSLGQKVISTKSKNNLNVSFLEKGVYIVTVSSENKQKLVKRVVVY